MEDSAVIGSQTAMANVKFVNATLSNPKAPKDPAIRTIIRKQAMKVAADTRRRDGSYGRHNLRQYPVFHQSKNDGTAAREFLCQEELDSNGHAAGGSESRSSQSYSGNGYHAQNPMPSIGNIPQKPSMKGFEFVTIKNRLDVVDLSTLANYYIGRATVEALSSDPLQLFKLLDFKQWSYMSYLPNLYGNSACLDHAIDCITARARNVVSQNSEAGESEVIGLYLKSIKSLQSALSCPTKRLTADVLCATEILALYELLDPSGKERWIRHANGATHLIRLRGPGTYNTEFEKALFMAHSGAIMTESLLNNEKCFLAQPAWQAVFQSLIIPGPEEISDRSETVVSLLILKSRVSALFAEVTDPVCRPRAYDSWQLSFLFLQLSGLRTDILQWHSKYAHLLDYSPNPRAGSLEYNKRCGIVSTYISCSMITNRLLVAISLSSYESVGLEQETQRLAYQMLELEKQVQDGCPHTRLFLAQTVLVANATITTASDWMASASESRVGMVIEKWKFERWCGLFGRKVS